MAMDTFQVALDHLNVIFVELGGTEFTLYLAVGRQRIHVLIDYESVKNNHLEDWNAELHRYC